MLGVHAIGTGATELIHIGQAVMAAGMPIDYFVDSACSTTPRSPSATRWPRSTG